MAGPTFELTVMSEEGVVFDGAVESVYLSGYEGEFEILAHHFPLLAALPEGSIKIASHESIPIEEGVLFFKENKCKIIVSGPSLAMKKKWDKA